MVKWKEYKINLNYSQHTPLIVNKSILSGVCIKHYLRPKGVLYMTNINEQTIYFNKSIKVNFDGGDLTSDSGILLYK